MNNRLQHHFDTLQLQKEKLIERIRQSPEKFDIKPNNASWSIHEVVAHIITAEKLSAFYLQKKIQAIDNVGNTGLWEEFKMLSVRIAQRLPLKFKAPKKVVERTTSYKNLDELIHDWNDTRDLLRVELEKINDHQVKRKIFKHIVAGRMNAAHAIEFLHEHINHHQRQLNRLLR